MPEEEKEETPLVKKIRSKLTSYEWKKLKEKIKLEQKMSSFRREYRQQMVSFIIGAFSFVAALVWRDAIKSVLDMIISRISLPVHQEWMAGFVTALLVSGIAIIAIIITSRTLKTSDNKEQGS